MYRYRFFFLLDLLLSSLLHSLFVSGHLLLHSLLLSFPPSLSDPPSPLRPVVVLRLLTLLYECNFLLTLASYSHLLASLLNMQDPPNAVLLE
jgi:hypothetical protein